MKDDGKWRSFCRSHESAAWCHWSLNFIGWNRAVVHRCSFGATNIPLATCVNVKQSICGETSSGIASMRLCNTWYCCERKTGIIIARALHANLTSSNTRYPSDDSTSPLHRVEACIHLGRLEACHIHAHDSGWSWHEMTKPSPLHNFERLRRMRLF